MEYFTAKQALLCIDNDEELAIRGESSFDSVELQINLIACDSSQSNHSCKFESPSELKDWLGHPELVVIYNEVTFDNRYYKEEDYFSKKAKMISRHVDKRQNNQLDVRTVQTLI
jgi:hypothetical protein